MTKDPHYPAMKWHPVTGEYVVCQNESEVPEGYIDTHPNNLPPAKAEEAVKAYAASVPAAGFPAKLPMKKADIITALTEGGIAHDPAAKAIVLYDALLASLKAHLTEAEVEFPENATAPELLALVPKPE